MSGTTQNKSLREQARIHREEKEADERLRQTKQERLERCWCAIDKLKKATFTLRCALDNSPPSARELEEHYEDVTDLLIEVLAALRNADRLSMLEELDETATLANHRWEGDDSEGTRIAYSHARQMIEADPSDRHQLAELVRDIGKEPGLRRALDWLYILVDGLTDRHWIVRKQEPSDLAGPDPPSSLANEGEGTDKRLKSGRARERDEQTEEEVKGIDGHSAPPSATKEKEGTGGSGRLNKGHQSNSKGAVTQSRSSGVKTRLSSWALAIEHGGAWHLFKEFGSEWRHQGKAQGISKGRQQDLLKWFAEGGGFLSDEEAVKSIRRTASREDRMKIMKQIKPEISRLRKVIRQNLRITGDNADPLPRDKQIRGWQAAIQVGYAVKNDEGRLEFKLRQQLSADEALDQG